MLIIDLYYQIKDFLIFMINYEYNDQDSDYILYF